MKTLLATVTYLLKEDQVLMVYGDKSYAPHYLKWNGPGGKVEDRDNGDPIVCAKRETFEETGLIPINLKLAAKIHSTGLFPGKEFVVYYYVCTEFDGNIKPRDGESEARWCKIQENGLPDVPILEGDKELFKRIISGQYFEGRSEYDGRDYWLGFTEGVVSKN